MFRRWPLVVALILPWSLVACGGGSDGDTLKIGVLQIAQAPVLDDAVRGFESALTKGVPGRHVDVEVKNANGDQSLVASLSRDLAGGDYDAYAVIGTPAVTALVQQVRDKPIFAIAMGDPVGAKVAKSLEAPGGNVTGSTDYVDPAELLRTVDATTPRPRTIGTILDPSNQNMAIWSKALTKAARANGDKVVEATVSGAGDVPSAARSLDGRADLVLIGPDATTLSAIDAVGAATAKARLPMIVVGGEISVKGVTASIGPDYRQVGRQAGEAAVQVLEDGKKPGAVAFTKPRDITVQVDRSEATSLGVTIPTGAS